jgi:hypothetical protein
MPHALFIGSRLATVDRLDLLPSVNPSAQSSSDDESINKWRLPSRDISAIFPSSWRTTFRRMDISSRRKEKQRARDDVDEFELGGVGGGEAGDLGRVVSADASEKEKDENMGGSSASATRAAEDQVEVLDSPSAPFNRLNFVKQHINQCVSLFVRSSSLYLQADVPPYALFLVVLPPVRFPLLSCCLSAAAGC